MIPPIYAIKRVLNKSPIPSNLQSSFLSLHKTTSYDFVFSFRRSITSYYPSIANIGISKKTDLTVRNHSTTYVQQHMRNITMASATSIYEFEPLNSMFLSIPCYTFLYPSSSLFHPSSLVHPPHHNNILTNLLSHPIEKGEPTPLSEFKGKVLLIVNTASKCGFTPQYEGLEKLYKDVKEKHGDDFVILGFPCNQFGSQEPGSDEDIQSFCQINYGVSFPIVCFSAFRFLSSFPYTIIPDI